MRSYLILKAKAERFALDPEIQGLLAELHADPQGAARWLGPYDRSRAQALQAHAFDRAALGARGLRYEKLDQLTMELLLGVR